MGGRRAFKAGLLVAIVVLCACPGSDEPGSSPSEKPYVEIPFGELPSVAVEHDGFMWVLDRRDGGLAKIDPNTNEVVETFFAGARARIGPIGAPWGLGAAGDSLWVSGGARGDLVEIDPRTGEVVDVVENDASVTDIHTVEDSLWLSTRRQLLELDANSKEIVNRVDIPRGHHMTDVVQFGRFLWLVTDRARYIGGGGPNPTHLVSSDLWRVDTERGRLINRVALGSTYARGAVDPVVGDVEVGEDGLWMSRPYEGRLLLVDPISEEVLLQFPIAAFEFVWEFAVVDGDLWAGDLNNPEVMWIDPDTRARELFEIDAETSFIGGGFSSAWVPVAGSPPDGGRVLRLDPPD